MSAPEFVIVLTTLPMEEDATSFATTLVEERLAACVNIHGEVRSIYRWQGTIEHDQEHPIVIKTTSECLSRLFERIRELHPYDVPEFVVLPVVDGSGAYLNWIRDSTSPVPVGEGES
jgi:periplasmic divalent cation tolerance protein